MNEHEFLGQFLRKKREKQNLTQIEVAEALGYASSQFISNWERGESSPPYEVLPALLILYKMKPQELTKFILKIHKTRLEEVLSA